MKLAQVYDLNGKLISETKLISPTLNTESLSKGTYIIMLRDENDKDYSKKFIKD
jgi:hypothetical protein